MAVPISHDDLEEPLLFSYGNSSGLVPLNGNILPLCWLPLQNEFVPPVRVPLTRVKTPPDFILNLDGQRRPIFKRGGVSPNERKQPLQLYPGLLKRHNVYAEIRRQRKFLMGKQRPTAIAANLLAFKINEKEALSENL
jgi:hypothetical protein